MLAKKIHSLRNWGFGLLFGAAMPISCSEETPKDGGDADGSMGGSIVVDLPGMGGSASLPNACADFIGLGNCGTEGVAAEPLSAQLLLVIDKSGSMDALPEESATETLWESTVAALSDVVAEASADVSFGLQMYPGRTVPLSCHPNCCEMPEGSDIDVPFSLGEANRAEIIEMLSRTRPGGGTPTAQALSRAYEYFHTGEGAELKGNRFVLLATDGGPNCNDSAECEKDACTINIDGQCFDDSINCCASNQAGCLDDEATRTVIQDLRSIGVDTFVIGLAGTDEYKQQLESFAEAGGRPRQGKPESYFRVDAKDSAQGLTEVLLEITQNLVQSCDVPLSAAPVDENLLNVSVDCEVFPRAVGDSGQGGQGGGSDMEPSAWILDKSIDPPIARLRGEICRKIEEEGVKRIDILQGCPTVR